MQLTQDIITAAALDILDEYGLADMTMRRLAKQLQVAPGALYWHFPNKQALITAISRTILEPALNETDTTAPVTDPIEACTTIRSSMLAHRDGAELVTAALSHSGLREELEHILTAALKAQFTADESYLRIGATTLLHFVMGATLHEQSALQLIADTHPGDDSVTATLETTREHFNTTFDNGVGIIVKGLATTI